MKNPKDIFTILNNLEEEVERLSGKTILITGGKGFLGTYIVNTFIISKIKCR